MRLSMVALVLAVLALPPTAAQAGLHLGMKLACKRYGDAWNSGSRSALWGSSTSDFASVWSRMPAEDFAELPRGGKSKVIASHKDHGSGTVTVSTSHGPMTLLLVGHGMKWTVADIYRAGDDGRTVSVKNYVDATLTAREFMHDLKYVGRDSFYDSITPDFRAAFATLSPADLDRVRQFLPDLDKTPKPYVTMDDDSALVRVQIPGQGPQDVITFQLVRSNSWRVADYSVDSRTVQIASFRRSVATIAAISAFGEFVDSPQSLDPSSFTMPGELCSSLKAARNETPFPITPPGERLELKISDDGCIAQLRYPTRSVRIHLAPCPGGPERIGKVELGLGREWTDLAGLLTTRRQLQQFSLVAAITQMSRPAEPKAPASAVSTSATAPTMSSQPAAAIEPQRLQVASLSVPTDGAAIRAESVGPADSRVVRTVYRVDYGRSHKMKRSRGLFGRSAR